MEQARPRPSERRQPKDVDFYAEGRRVLDRESGLTMVKLFSGDCFVSRDRNEMLVTILGSCVAACIRDPFAGVGGMNHFLLPGDTGQEGLHGGSTRYGVNAMEMLINGILKQGGSKDRLEVKVFGGGNVTGNMALIGSRNAAFVREFLDTEGLSIKASDLEGAYPRRIHYTPATGKVMMRQLKREDDKRVLAEERVFEKSLRAQPISGDIELF